MGKSFFSFRFFSRIHVELLFILSYGKEVLFFLCVLFYLFPKPFCLLYSNMLLLLCSKPFSDIIAL